MSPGVEGTGSLEALVPRGVRRGVARTETEARWGLETFAGRFGEIRSARASASLTLVFRLVLEAQRSNEPVAWIGGREGVFFPPDADDAGVDLAALPVIRVRGPLVAARVADCLVRTGAFGLIVMDLGTNDRLPLAAQTRLVGLAQKHATAIFCITEADGRRASTGSLVSLRAETRRTERIAGGFRCEARMVKDKRRPPNWAHAEVCRAPDGLR